MIGITRSFFVVCLLAFSMAVGAQSTEEIKQLAEQGDALGQAKLASLYLLGRNGIELDNNQAAKWMTKAAEQGLVEAQVVLAAMNDRGMGVSASPKKATEWYEKAAKQGHATSLAILGRNPTAKGSVKFSYQGMRLNAGRQIPKEYAKRFLMQK
jgi:TPR repeat protein